MFPKDWPGSIGVALCSISERAIRVIGFPNQRSCCREPFPGSDKVRYVGSSQHRSSWMRSSPCELARKPLRNEHRPNHEETAVQRWKIDARMIRLDLAQ